MEGDAQFFKGEAVVDFEGEMVEEDGFVSFEEEPVFDFANDFLATFCFLVLLGNGLVDILFLGLIGVSGLDDWYFFVFCGVGHFDLLYDFLVLEVDGIHFGAHF